MCYGYNIQQVQKMIKQQLPEAGGDLHGFDRPKAPIITQVARKVEYYHWWLLPSFFKEEDYSVNLLNARAETVFEKASFRSIIRTQRCLVPATHYYEHQWRDEKGRVKHKYKLGVKNQDGFFMAGIFDHWIHPNTQELKQTFTILTTEANELCAEIHNTKKRMPVILTNENAKVWLKPSLSDSEILALAKPLETDKMFAENLDATKNLFSD